MSRADLAPQLRQYLSESSTQRPTYYKTFLLCPVGPNYSVVLCDLQELFFLFLSGGSFLGLGLFSVRKARSALSQRVRVTPLQIFGAHCLCSSLLYGNLLSKLCRPSGSPRPLHSVRPPGSVWVLPPVS